MCGIFGYVGPNAPDLTSALAALAHRGPDGAGSFEDSADGAFGCGLAHTRLAIIDLSERGRQPMCSADGRFAIVYNGEVYNHASIRRDIEARGVALTSTSDTEVLLEGFALWGPSVVDRLRGMFAFAIWDTKEKRLFLTRDRLGIKPLYLLRRGNGAVFSSELRALIRSGAIEPRLSQDGVASYLAWGAVQEPHTILEGVRSVGPGSFVTIDAVGVREATYWEPPVLPTLHSTRAAAEERIHPVLREAVALRLVADVPVGVFLSGGIDSSVIAALASARATSQLHTFTVAFEEQRMSEAPYASAVAERLGTRHHTLLLRGSSVLDDLRLAVGALDQPAADGVNTYFVARAVRATGIRVALSGLGGDELFAGYGFFRRFAVAKAVAGRLGAPTALARAALLMDDRSPKLASLLTGPRGEAGAYAAFRHMFTPRQVAALVAFTPTQPATSPALPEWVLRGIEGGADTINVVSALELTNYLRNTLLRDADVMSMAHGLEVRVPLLDHCLVEQVLPTAGQLKLARGINKPLLVSAARGLPMRSLLRPKMGFTLPFEQWFRGPLKSFLDGLFSSVSTRATFLRGPETQGYWRAFLAGAPHVNAWRVWCLAALLAWCEENRVAP